MPNAIMAFFASDHLPDGPPHTVALAFAEFAQLLDQKVKDGAEKSAGLRKLMESKDCFVRAVLHQEVPHG